MYKKISLFEDDIEYTNKPLKEDTVSNAPFSHKIISELHLKIDELYDSIHFFERINSEPKIIFSEIDIFLNKKSAFFATFNSYYHRDGEGTSVHAIQLFFAQKANVYFQIWLKRNKIEGNFDIRVRQTSTYPSIFAIYKDSIEIMQFDLFNRWYGCRYLLRNSIEKKKSLTLQNKELSRLITEAKEKHSFSQKEQSSRLFSFSSPKELGRQDYLNIDGLLEQQMIVQNKLHHMDSDETINEYKRLFELFSSFFVEFDFTLNETEGSLY